MEIRQRCVVVVDDEESTSFSSEAVEIRVNLYIDEPICSIATITPAAGNDVEAGDAFEKETRVFLTIAQAQAVRDFLNATLPK